MASTDGDFYFSPLLCLTMVVRWKTEKLKALWVGAI
jgi:hypothetical protein